ncbi:CDP-alcohol phosphatidyltransferase family protein [Paenibacillus sp. MBLB4367]|uniref:CDP-alcohol phosphatidyltransferase family protein n=1 Tax=Paenibacillus sp. MBLB4367 TaxID=3384767 RepID=UPI0039080A27
MLGKSIPVWFTAASLGAGMISLLFTFHGQMLHAALSVVVSALLDVAGGFFTNEREQSNAFCKELRSLCELISFGAAPSFLVYAGILHELRTAGILLMALFLICGALRLARFNVSPHMPRYHTGLPITGAGCILSVFALWSPDLYLLEATVALIVLLSCLMVSTIKFPAMIRASLPSDTRNL